MEKGK